MTKQKSLPVNLLFIALIALGLIGSLISASHRWKAEARNRRVELVIDYGDAQALANTTSRQIDDVLTQLKVAGITTVAVTEDSLGTLNTNGVVTYARNGNSTQLTFAPGFPGQRARVVQMLAHKAPGLTVTPVGLNGLLVGAPWPQFNSIPIGLDSDTVNTIKRNKLLVAPRLVNFTGVTVQNIPWELAQTKRQCMEGAGIGPVIFAGTSVLGNRALIKTTADALVANHLTYGSVELGKMFGDDDLSRMADTQTVRVHSIGTDEMGTMEEPTAVERFVRAAKERNIRVCYVRLFISGLPHDPDVLQANTAFIEKIVRGMREAHLTVGEGPAHPYADDPKPGLPLRLLMALGVAGGTLLLLRVFTGISGRALVIASAVILVLALGAAAPGTTPKGRELLALVSACVFPTLGLCAISLPRPVSNGSNAEVLRWAFIAYLKMTLVTVIGILLVIGLLSGRLFLLKVDAFLGVKMVLVTPVALVAVYYGLGLGTLSARAGWAERRDTVLGNLRVLAAHPLLSGQVVIGIVALVALAFFVARSGNDPGVGVSATELKTRALLDHFLFVRPRFKEFLLGHPALLLGLAAFASKRFSHWVLPLLVVGAIGQSSLMDTFCHLHTPLVISALHGLIGWVLGAIFGVLIWTAVGIVEARFPAKAAE
ncbi:MAG: DUF5693 family protein [Janthinobacterium lividum]